MSQKITTTAPSPKRWNEENTVEHPILDWLQTLELGWRYETQAEVAEGHERSELGLEGSVLRLLSYGLTDGRLCPVDSGRSQQPRL